ncbi:MAG: gas vesicle protein K, partial [Candidatus Promineofilum sp.]|nr:gas vesicle protein K [Promineifilum sp.]
MTTTQTIVWIALPNGYAGEAPERRLRLSVFVAPRLRSDAGSTLALYPDFLDWAARLGPDVTSFALEVDDGTVVPATVVSEPPDPLLWAAFFRGDTPVRPFQFDDYADRPIVSYPVRDVLNFVKRVYRETAAASPTDLPRIAPDPDDPERGPALTQLFRELIHGPHREIMRVPDEATLTERLGSSLERARQQARAR